MPTTRFKFMVASCDPCCESAPAPAPDCKCTPQARVLSRLDPATQAYETAVFYQNADGKVYVAAGSTTAVEYVEDWNQTLTADTIRLSGRIGLRAVSCDLPVATLTAAQGDVVLQWVYDDTGVNAPATTLAVQASRDADCGVLGGAAFDRFCNVQTNIVHDASVVPGTTSTALRTAAQVLDNNGDYIVLVEDKTVPTAAVADTERLRSVSVVSPGMFAFDFRADNSSASTRTLVSRAVLRAMNAGATLDLLAPSGAGSTGYRRVRVEERRVVSGCTMPAFTFPVPTCDADARYKSATRTDNGNPRRSWYQMRINLRDTNGTHFYLSHDPEPGTVHPGQIHRIEDVTAVGDQFHFEVRTSTGGTGIYVTTPDDFANMNTAGYVGSFSVENGLGERDQFFLTLLERKDTACEPLPEPLNVFPPLQQSCPPKMSVYEYSQNPDRPRDPTAVAAYITLPNGELFHYSYTYQGLFSRPAVEVHSGGNTDNPTYRFNVRANAGEAYALVDRNTLATGNWDPFDAQWKLESDDSDVSGADLGEYPVTYNAVPSTGSCTMVAAPRMLCIDEFCRVKIAVAQCHESGSTGTEVKYGDLYVSDTTVGTELPPGTSLVRVLDSSSQPLFSIDVASIVYAEGVNAGNTIPRSGEMTARRGYDNDTLGEHHDVLVIYPTPTEMVVIGVEGALALLSGASSGDTVNARATYSKVYERTNMAAATFPNGSECVTVPLYKE